MSQEPKNSPPAKGEYAEGGRGFVLPQQVGERLHSFFTPPKMLPNFRQDSLNLLEHQLILKSQHFNPKSVQKYIPLTVVFLCAFRVVNRAVQLDG